MRQAIFEQMSEMEELYNIRHTKDITIYLTPTNGFGDEVLCLDQSGKEVTTLFSSGPYRCAADDYQI